MASRRTEQFPYARADLTPLMPDELLSRPASDPDLVDVISLTDFYRVRASIFARAPAHRRVAPLCDSRPARLGQRRPPGNRLWNHEMQWRRANLAEQGQRRVVSSPAHSGPSGFDQRDASRQARFPPEAPFSLEPVSTDLEGVNRLEGTPLWAPETAPNGMPVGGIPMLDAALPLGLPRPIALPPVEIASISDTCGNFSGWEPFSVEELTRRYGGRANYIETGAPKGGRPGRSRLSARRRSGGCDAPSRGATSKGLQIERAAPGFSAPHVTNVRRRSARRIGSREQRSARSRRAHHAHNWPIRSACVVEKFDPRRIGEKDFLRRARS